MLESIKKIDVEILLWINQHHTTWLDTIMMYTTHRFFWIWMYLFFAFLLYKKWKWKGVALLVAILGIVVIVDFLSVHVFKNTFQRYRPCHHLEIKNILRLPLNRCGGMFGFISSHAANTTALAALLLFLQLPKQFPRISNLLIVLLGIYVFLNCYSRMYLGVHYPTDILSGFLFGLIMAWLGAKLIQKIAFFSFTKE